MTEPETALDIVTTGSLGLLEQDGRAARDYARESLSPATRRSGGCGLRPWHAGHQESACCTVRPGSSPRLPRRSCLRLGDGAPVPVTLPSAGGPGAAGVDHPVVDPTGLGEGRVFWVRIGPEEIQGATQCGLGFRELVLQDIGLTQV